MAKGKKGKSTKGKETSEKLSEALSSIDGELPFLCPEQLPEEVVFHIADFFKVFGDSTRVKILVLLLKGELSVGEISQKLTMSQSAVSHQLRVLRQSNLVKYRKEGKMVFYCLDDDHVKLVLEQGIHHVCHKKNYSF